MTNYSISFGFDFNLWVHIFSALMLLFCIWHENSIIWNTNYQNGIPILRVSGTGKCGDNGLALTPDLRFIFCYLVHRSRRKIEWRWVKSFILLVKYWISWLLLRMRMPDCKKDSLFFNSNKSQPSRSRKVTFSTRLLHTLTLYFTNLLLSHKNHLITCLPLLLPLFIDMPLWYDITFVDEYEKWAESPSSALSFSSYYFWYLRPEEDLSRHVSSKTL